MSVTSISTWSLISPPAVRPLFQPHSTTSVLAVNNSTQVIRSWHQPPNRFSLRLHSNNTMAFLCLRCFTWLFIQIARERAKTRPWWNRSWLKTSSVLSTETDLSWPLSLFGAFGFRTKSLPVEIICKGGRLESGMTGSPPLTARLESEAEAKAVPSRGRQRDGSSAEVCRRSSRWNARARTAD